MSRRLHVALATTEFPPMAGGLATYCQELATQLAAAGQRVTVVTSSDPPPDLPADGPFQVVSVAVAVRHFSGLLLKALQGSQPELVQPIAIGLAIRDWLQSLPKAEAPEVIEAPDFFGFAAFLTEAELPALTITAHGCLAQIAWHEQLELSPGSRSRVALEWLGMLRADGLCALSPMNAKDVGLAMRREVEFIPPPWRSQPVAAQAKLSGLSAVPRGMVAARLQNWKGVEDVCLALRLCTSKGVPWVVDWCGRDTPTGPGGESMAAYLARQYPDVWGNSFIWHGEQSRAELNALRQQSWCCLVPSRWDTLNYTVFEAMAHAQPLVVSTGAGAVHWCRHEENALIFPASDPGRLAEAMIRLANEAGLRDQLAAGAAATVAEFSDANNVGQRIEFYRRAIESREKTQLAGWARPDYATLLAGLSEPLTSVLKQMSGGMLLQELTGRVAQKLSRGRRVV